VSSPQAIYLRKRGSVEFISFDEGYVQGLAAGDASTVEHFNRYFGELIFIKLRSRQYSSQMIEDVRQETFLRVFQVLRRDGIRQPERIGAFVNAICNNVVMEFGRASSRLTYMDDPPDQPSYAASADDDLMERERRAHVRRILEKMPAKNQKLLTAVFIEERPPDEVCAEMGIDRNYLRVLLFRARTQLKEAVHRKRVANGE
jgi:RNA polymerase sigma-70 factor, ECF subfamily